MGRPPGSRNKPKEPPKAPPVPSRLPEDFVYEVDENEDRLFVPPEIIPDGMTYQWITDSIFGQQQPLRRAKFERKGWLPVPAERHPGRWMPMDYKGEINVDGLVLMERPAEFTRRAQEHERRKAREQVWIKEQQLRGGDVGTTLDSHHRSAQNFNHIRKSYERFEVPDDN